MTSTLTNSVSPAPVILTLAKRELVRFFRQRNRVIGAMVQPIMFWGLFSAGFVGSGLGAAFFFPGTIAMILLFTAHFFYDLDYRRSPRRIFAVGVGRTCTALGDGVWENFGRVGDCYVTGIAVLVLGWLTLQLTSSPLEVVLAVALMSVIAVALTSLGFFIAWRMESTQGFHAIMSVFCFRCGCFRGRFFRLRKVTG